MLIAIFAPLISPQNPYDLAQLDVMDSRLPPGSASPTGGTFWLGTDDQGRDMLSAIFYGLRISLSVGVIATVIALAIGLALGLVAAYLGGRTETVPAQKLKRGDVVMVSAGEFIPGDGEIIEGVASVDESAITGESAPVIRESGGDRSAVTSGPTA